MSEQNFHHFLRTGGLEKTRKGGYRVEPTDDTRDPSATHKINYESYYRTIKNHESGYRTFSKLAVGREPSARQAVGCGGKSYIGMLFWWISTAGSVFGVPSVSVVG